MRLNRKDRDERFHLSSTQDEVKNSLWYGLINPFGKSKHGSTLVLSQISCIALGLALLEDEQKFKLHGCVGAHKTMISCTNMLSKYVK
jgi:hypothetical protein